jgi:hypothetical protein
VKDYWQPLKPLVRQMEEAGGGSTGLATFRVVGNPEVGNETVLKFPVDRQAAGNRD